MKSESQTQIEKEVLIYRNEVMTHLKYIKEKVNSNHRHLQKVNGRLTTAEHSITAMKTVGTTITLITATILTWLGIDK